MVPGFFGDLLEVVLEQIGHEHQELGQGPEIYFRRGASWHRGEPLYRLFVESPAVIGSSKGVCQEEVPGVLKGFEGVFELVWGSEGFGEHLTFHDTEPDFYQVEPGAVEGCEVDDYPLVISLQPVRPLRLDAQLFFRRAPDLAELCDELAKWVTAITERCTKTLTALTPTRVKLC